MKKDKLVLFGGGNIGEKTYKKYQDTYHIVAVIDNNVSAFHDRRCFDGNVPVIDLEEYRRSYAGVPVMISTAKANEIQHQLQEKGINDSILSPMIFQDDSVLTDSDIMHGRWPEYLQHLCNKRGYEVLEVGSRVVTGACFRDYFREANYTGFDYYEGENVDVIGDAHRLSSYFDKKFDLIFSSAVFEHLAMPWIAALEMIRLLKPGGYIFIETHYSFGSHERPWHFFQFSENALNVMFPEKFGIKCLKKGCCNLLEGRFSDLASEYLRGEYINGMYCHSEFLGQKIKNVSENELDWNSVSLDEISEGTVYPKHN